jgi:hypothetical protein
MSRKTVKIEIIPATSHAGLKSCETLRQSYAPAALYSQKYLRALETCGVVRCGESHIF